MAENIPLLPDKKNAVCADVREVLRETFRELDDLPPIINEQFGKGRADQLNLFDSDFLIRDLSTECKKLGEHEKELQYEYAKRLARDPLPNIYKLHSPRSPTEDKRWMQKFGLLQRKDLKPSIEQNANYDKSLWVQNILNRSSGDLTVLTKVSPTVQQVSLEPADEYSLQSMSLGEIIPRAPPPPMPVPPPPEMPAFIVCIPSQVEFVNFSVGKVYTQLLRLVNTSKVEISLSVRPPPRPDLRLELRSRLAVTSGAAAEISLHFTPRSVRAVTEELSVRVSVGRSLVIPIRCYMEPPLLEILVRNVTPNIQTFNATEIVQDVLDLGAKLLGDVHSKPLLFKSDAKHASFFILSEDSWQDNNIKVVRNMTKTSSNFGVVTDCFYISPAHWVGGVRGLSCSECTRGVHCGCDETRGTQGVVAARLTSAGTRVAALRIVSSTATVRSLDLVADALMFNPEHIMIKAQEKDFDICSEDDPYCKYYIHLGTAFPNQSLSATVQVVNHSPLTYNYYWASRKWGEAVSGEDFSDKQENKREFTISMKEANGMLLPRTSNPQSARAVDCGSELGTQRAVLMLILKNIPRESLPSDYDPIIVDSYTVQEKAIPGISASWSREVCSLVCAQLEVQWVVVPVRFTVDPPFIRLFCSKRVKSVTIPLRVTQLYGVTGVDVKRVSQEEPLRLIPGTAVTTTVILPLQITNKPVTEVITFTSLGGEWSASTEIEYTYRPRGPTLAPATTRLHTRPPTAAVCADLALYNNTYQDLTWHATCHPWCKRAATCSGHVCSTCVRRDCRCAALRPAAGEVAHAHDALLQYNVTAPDVEGCFATLIEVTTEEKEEEITQRNTAKSAALVAYRVLAPRLALRVVPCGGDYNGDCSVCMLDVGIHTVGVGKGMAVLRPISLRRDTRACCRLRLWNMTPLSTRVVWEQCEDDALKVTFLPNEFEVEGFTEANIMVLLEAKQVCRRKMFVCRAHVTHAHPLYLLIDTAITGVEVTIEFPIGGDEHTDSFVNFKMIQRQTVSELAINLPLLRQHIIDLQQLNILNEYNVHLKKEESSNIFSEVMSTSIEDIFTKEEIKRAKQQQKICHCPKKMVYIPPVKKPQPPKGPDQLNSPIEIVDTPPLTRVCRCAFCSKPMLPEQTEPHCLQFRKLPLNTVRSRTVVLRNEGGTAAHWRSAVRRWPRKRNARNVPWSVAPGIALQCAPAAGVLPPRGVVKVTVTVCADSWGLYHDQIAIQVEHLEPIVIDVWVEVIGSALQFALRPSEADDNNPPVLWMSTSDPERSVRFTNTSYADLIIYPYILKNHEYIQESFPFRLYVRLYDVLPPSCPCVTALQGHSEGHSKSSLFEEMDTGVELVLGPDYGVQDSNLYQVEPSQLQVKAHTSGAFRVHLLPLRDETPQATLLLRVLPVVVAREGWYRPTPPFQPVHIRTPQRLAHLQASCSEIRISLCALDLPCNEVMRLRKHFYIRNTGGCAILTRHETSAPWRAGRVLAACSLRCTSAGVNTDTSLTVPPHSSTEMFVEVSVSAPAWWPAHGTETQEEYPVLRIETEFLRFYDTDDVLLLTIPLVLLIDQPRLTLEPTVIDFGELGDGRSAKSYFTVAHSSPHATVEVVVSSKDEQFRVFPRALELAPGETRRVYVQCTARYQPSTTPGSDTFHTKASIQVHARGGAGAWCRASVQVTARAHLCTERGWYEDHTDDAHLVPDDVCRLLNI